MRYLIVVWMLSTLLGVLPAPSFSPALHAQRQQEPGGTASAMPKVNLNTADQSTLETLPGVGPRTAELIIEYRTEAGGFTRVEDLMNVRGIGERTFLRLRELVVVDAPTDER